MQRKFVFASGKISTLDATEDLGNYQHDLHSEPLLFSKRIQIGCSVVNWEDFNAKLKNLFYFHRDNDELF